MWPIAWHPMAGSVGAPLPGALADVVGQSACDAGWRALQLRQLLDLPGARQAMQARVDIGEGILVRGVTFSVEDLRRALHVAGDGSSAPEAASAPAPRRPGGASGSAGVVADGQEATIAQPDAETSDEDASPPSEPDMPDGQGAAVADEDEDIEKNRFVLSPHADCVHLAWHPGLLRWQVVHSTTHERVTLPIGEREWCFDTDSPHYLVFDTPENGDPQVFEVDELFEHRLFDKLPSGEQWLVQEGSTGMVRRRPLHVVVSDHSIGTVSCQLGPSAAEDKLDFAAFVLPRDASHCFWSLSSIASVLNLAPKGVGTYIQKYIRGWERLFGVFGLEPPLRSQQYIHQRTADGEDRSRVLPWISCSSFGLVVLLTKWVFAPPSRGQLKDQTAMSACRLLVDYLVRVGLGCEGKFLIYCRALQERSATCPMPTGLQGVVVSHDSSSRLNLRSLLSSLEQSRQSSQAVELLRDLAAEREDGLAAVLFVSVLAKFWGFGEGSKVSHFLKQFCWYLATRVDATVYKCVREGSSDLISLDMALSAAGLQTQKYLALYHQACAEAADGDLRFLSCSCDKSRVHTLNMSNAAFALPTNVAWWGVPQASKWPSERGQHIHVVPPPDRKTISVRARPGTGGMFPDLRYVSPNKKQTYPWSGGEISLWRSMDS